MRLRHWLASVGLLVCLASLVGHGQAPTAVAPRTDGQTPAPTFRTSAEAVANDVFVTDTDGNPVSGLTVDDFELFENGKPQDITTFRAVDVPVEVREDERPSNRLVGSSASRHRRHIQGRKRRRNGGPDS